MKIPPVFLKGGIAEAVSVAKEETHLSIATWAKRNITSWVGLHRENLSLDMTSLAL